MLKETKSKKYFRNSSGERERKSEREKERKRERERGREREKEKEREKERERAVAYRMTWPGRVKQVSLLCRIYDEDGAALRSEEDSGRHVLVSCTYIMKEMEVLKEAEADN